MGGNSTVKGRRFHYQLKGRESTIIKGRGSNFIRERIPLLKGGDPILKGRGVHFKNLAGGDLTQAMPVDLNFKMHGVQSPIKG